MKSDASFWLHFGSQVCVARTGVLNRRAKELRRMCVEVCVDSSVIGRLERVCVEVCCLWERESRFTLGRKSKRNLGVNPRI